MSRLAHDLRGPLSPVQTAAFLLRDERVGPSKRGELLDVIDRQSRRLAAMIDEIGDWARAGQGSLIERNEESGLAVLLDGIAAPGTAVAPELRFGPGTHGLRVQGDAARLGQLLRTLATVRLVHDDAHPVRIHVELATPTRVRVLRHVACAGAAVEQVGGFLEEPLSDPHDDGLGLGLLVARAIAEAHGGSLCAQAIDADTIELKAELPLARRQR